MTADRDIMARHVGGRIRALREAGGVEAATLAEQLDMSPADLERFESGERRIAPNLLVAMAKLYGVGIDWFFRDAPPDRRSGGFEQGVVVGFLSLPDAPAMMRAFVGIPNWEGRQIVVNFARFVASPTG